MAHKLIRKTRRTKITQQELTKRHQLAFPLAVTGFGLISPHLLARFDLPDKSPHSVQRWSIDINFDGGKKAAYQVSCSWNELYRNVFGKHNTHWPYLAEFLNKSAPGVLILDYPHSRIYILPGNDLFVWANGCVYERSLSRVNKAQARIKQRHLETIAAAANEATTFGRFWRRRASCQPGSGIDPELFFSPHVDDQLAAVQICQRCPVMTQCLLAALQTKPTDGIFGGLLPLGRDDIERKLTKVPDIALEELVKKRVA